MSRGEMIARSLLFYLFFWSWTIILGVGASPLLLSARLSRSIPDLWIKVTLYLLRAICKLHIDIRGREYMPSGPAIYASKHQSALDTLVLWQLLNGPVFILKRELLRIPIFGWYLWRMQPIAINRGARSEALQAIRDQASERAHTGRNIIIFPEGTRTTPGASVHYKNAGISLLYRELNLPVVPVALNTGVFWARNALIKRPGATIIECLPPIAPGYETEDMLARVRESIETRSLALINA